MGFSRYLRKPVISDFGITTPQNQIVNNVTSSSSAEVVMQSQNNLLIGTSEIVPQNTIIKIKKVKIFTTPLDDLSMLKINIKP